MGKNEDGSDITQDFDVLCLLEGRWASSISSYISDGTPVPGYSCSQCNSLSDLRKSLLEGTLELIMWAKWGSPIIPFGRDDLHITPPDLRD